MEERMHVFKILYLSNLRRNTQVMYTLALVLIFLYVSCCAYNLVWLLHPR